MILREIANELRELKDDIVRLEREHSRMKQLLTEIAHSKGWNPTRWLLLIQNLVKELEGGKPT